MTAKQERDDVDELTAALRADRVLAGLRKGLIAKGISPDDCLLAGFMESEDGREWGAIVTRTRQVFEYERRTNDPDEPDFIRWKEHRVPARALARDAFPGIPYALEMLASPSGGDERAKTSTTKKRTVPAKAPPKKARRRGPPKRAR